MRPFATSTSRAGVRTPFATSSTATSAIQTALGGGALRATRIDGAGLAHAASSATAANTPTREPTRFVRAPPLARSRAAARIVTAFDVPV